MDEQSVTLEFRLTPKAFREYVKWCEEQGDTEESERLVRAKRLLREAEECERAQAE